MFPIDIPEDDEYSDFVSNLIEVRSDKRLEPDHVAVYLLKCGTGPREEFASKFDDKMTPDFEDIKESIRRRWELTRREETWDEDDLEFAANVHIDKGYHEDLPDSLNWKEEAIEANEIYYVGLTNNLLRRMREHIRGDNSYFTSIVRPVQLVDVEWFESRSKAEEAERELANSYKERDGVFAKGGDLQVTTPGSSTRKEND